MTVSPPDKPINRLGLTTIYESASPAVDIVFIHGFTGKPDKTWASHDPAPKCRLFGRSSSSAPPLFWPRDLVSATLPSSRILTYGYDTDVRHFFNPISQNTLNQHAWDFACALSRERSGHSWRPILFVVHSLGGILVKEALRRSRSASGPSANVRQLFDATIGVIFFATPHSGADPRGLVHHVLQATAELLGVKANPDIVKTLMPDSEHLEHLNSDFLEMCRTQRWLVYSFQEEYGVPGLMGKKVVEDHSSCLKDDSFEVRLSIASNHMDMCRFGGPHDPQYAKVAEAMKHILRHSAEEVKPRADDDDDDHTTLQEKDSHDVQQPQVQNLAQGDAGEKTTPTNRNTDRASHINADVQKRLIDSLDFEQIDQRLTDIPAALRDTCRWFFETETYTRWSAASGCPEFLWIKGHPGTGKSTLMKTLFEHTEEMTRNDSHHICLSFFFHARGVTHEKTAVGLYRALLHQLLETADDFANSLAWLTASGARVLARNGWNEAALKRTLLDVIGKLDGRELTIFVDALDECDQAQVHDMIDQFEAMCDSAREENATLRICFSSRHYPTLTIDTGSQVKLEDEAGHTSDIQKYVGTRLKLGSLSKTSQAQELQTLILEKSSNIFLWVVLVVEIINKEFRNPVGAAAIAKMHARVLDIPEKLHELFDMVLQRDGDSLEETRICLTTIMFAWRGLSPQELFFAVQLGLDAQASTYWDHDLVSVEQMEEYVRSSSKGLAEVTRQSHPTVQLIHESVRDFLLEKGNASWLGLMDNSDGYGQQLLRDNCVAQIVADLGDHEPPRRVPSQDMRNTWERLQPRFPFLGYAANSVFYHANQAQGEGLSQQEFITSLPFELQRWMKLYSIGQPNRTRRIKSSASLLYVLAFTDAEHLIALLPNAGRKCLAAEPGMRFGSPLLAAAATGSRDAALELIKQYVDDDAVKNSELQVVCRQILETWRDSLDLPSEQEFFIYKPDKPLLEHKAIFNWGGPIIAACALFDEENIPGTLAAWFDKNTADQGDGNLLTRAVFRGDAAYIDFILKAGQLLGRRPTDKVLEYALHNAASHRGNAACIAILLDAKVDLESRDQFGQTALSIAADLSYADLEYATDGYVDRIKMLLDAGARVDCRDNDGRTPLSSAVHCNKPRGVVSVRYLLSAGARVDSRDNKGLTPLSWAAFYGAAPCIKVLLDAGAKLESRDDQGRTPLSWAASSFSDGVPDSLRALIDAGAQVESRDVTGRTPLSWAGSSPNSSHAEVLITAGARMDTRDNDGCSPLLWAARDHRFSIVEFLLLPGARALVNCADNLGRTPLSWAVTYPLITTPDILEALIDAGANVDMQCAKGRTPLMYAVIDGRSESDGFLRLQVAKSLVQKGARTDLRDESGKSALDHAVETNDGFWGQKIVDELQGGPLLDATGETAPS